ncbi:hypothetical protein DFS33DRAFT_832825 [Desarmillaria ectypa]|nr:hypothetical protein DFS33DRAFT_832825 [Desarmillaria ectypa]
MSIYVYYDIEAEMNGAIINKCWPIRRALVVVIILLHALTTVNFAAYLSYIHSSFIENGQSFSSMYLKLNGTNQATFLEMGIAAAMSTILTDLYMIWYCWMVWGRRRLVVLFPILFLISATVSKIIVIYHDYFGVINDVFPMPYMSFILATTLWCTLLIIYRIVTVAGVRHGTEGRLRFYHHFIEVLVESSALYSISLVLLLAFTIRSNLGEYYLDTIAGIAKGIAPTLLVGRAAAGHTRPNDDSDQSTVSTLHFRTPSELGATSLQESTMQSAHLEMDIEAQPEWSNELVVVVEKTQ